MTLRTTRKKNKDGSIREYLEIVQAYRPKGKKYSTQKVIASLGRVDHIEKKHITTLAKKLMQFAEIKEFLTPESKLFLNHAIDYGPRVLVAHIWKKLGMDRILAALDLTESAQNSLFLMVLARLQEPLSKRGSHAKLHQYLLPHEHHWSLSTLYRALDRTVKYREEIENSLYQIQYSPSSQFDLFQQNELDILFYDTTTISIKTKVDNDESLFQYGYNKDHRNDIPQFLVGVLMTSAQDPIAHYILPGNMTDKKAMLEMLNNARQRFCIKRVIFIADRGCVDKEIISTLKSQSLEYITGAKLRLEKKFKQLLSIYKDGFTPYDDVLSYKEVSIDDERAIIVNNAKMAIYHQNTREKILKKLELQQGKSIAGLSLNRGYKKYLQSSGKITVDAEKVKRDALFDGKWILRTNVKDFTPVDLIESYKSLWHVEQWFDCLKNQLDVMPVHHWTQTRVTGHVLVCFLAMKVWAYFTRHIAKADPTASPLDLWRSLSTLKAAEIQVEDTKYFVRCDLSPLVSQVFQALNAPIPPLISVLP